MSKQVIEVEAETLEEARSMLRSSIPEGFEIITEQILSDGSPQTQQATGITIEAAFIKAEYSVPKGAEIIERREITSPTVKTITVDAPTEQQAKAQVEQRLDVSCSIDAIVLTKRGETRFLGIGRLPNQYQVTILQHGIVEITYKVKVKIIGNCGLLKEMLLEFAEKFTGEWPTELPRHAFDQIDLDKLIARLKHYQEMAYPGLLGDFLRLSSSATPLPTSPSYSIVNGKIARKSFPAFDALLLQTAAVMSSAVTGVKRTINPSDPSTSRLALLLIDRYVDKPLAKFLFSLPRHYDFLKARKQVPSHLVWEDYLQDISIDIYKGMENTLFEIYDDLPEGEVFTDETVTQKLLSLVHAKQ